MLQKLALNGAKMRKSRLISRLSLKEQNLLLIRENTPKSLIGKSRIVQKANYLRRRELLYLMKQNVKLNKLQDLLLILNPRLRRFLVILLCKQLSVFYYVFSKSDKVTISDEIKYVQKNLPGPNKYEPNLESVSPNARRAFIKLDIVEKPTKFIKTNDPNPHSYNTEQAYKKTHSISPIQTFKKEKLSNFFEI